MIAEFGQVSLILAFSLAVLQATLPLIGIRTQQNSLIFLASPLVRGQWLFLTIAMICLGASFVNNDFSVMYVAQNSNTALPLPYRIAAIWGGHEGSLLLWVFLLNSWGIAVSFRTAHLSRHFVARVLSVLGMVSLGFLAFMLFTSNPFERLFPAPFEGADLNPLLQDPALVLHPPMLYMGYVGFSITFCFAIAALLEGRLDAAWARWSRTWAMGAWTFLTLGIGLGSWWAYYELGWGGWWFWDPVENASLMPWMAGTALLHSLAVTDKRNVFKRWTVLIAILAFTLSLLGTFLVRSGVLTSVHAFATDPTRGLFILLFLATVVGASLALFGIRAKHLDSQSDFSWCSKEAAMLTNNVLLLVTLGTIMLGTLYPMILDALDLGKISVGPPYFNTVIVPVMAPLLLLLGLAQPIQWRRDTLIRLRRYIRWPLLLSLLLPLFVQASQGTWSPGITFGLFVSGWVICNVLRDVFNMIIGPRAPWQFGKACRTQRSFLGMSVAHLGLGLFVLGVTISGGFSTEKETTLTPGESVNLGVYEFIFIGSKSVTGPNYEAQQGEVVVNSGGKQIATLLPEKRTYLAQNRVMTEASIDAGLTRHLYAALGEPGGDGAWSLRLYFKPFIQWIWMGVLFMALGGALAASDRRYRIRTGRKSMLSVSKSAHAEEISQ